MGEQENETPAFHGAAFTAAATRAALAMTGR